MKNKKTLVFIHGYADNSNVFQSLFTLIKHRYNCLAIDLPTVSSPKQEFTLNQLAQHAANFIKKLPQNKIHLIGFSLGGLIAADVACKIPRKISSLMLLNSSPKLKIPRLLRPFIYTKNPLAIKTFSHLKFKTVGSVLTLQDIIKETSSTDNLLNKYKNLKIPKQIILFQDDKLVKHRPNYKLLTQNNLQVISVKNGGHAAEPNYWLAIAQKIQQFI